MIAIPLADAAEMQKNSVAAMYAEGELFSVLRSGNQQQFKKLYHMYAPSLSGIISSIVKSEEVAEDVLQETFVKIWKSLEGFDPERGRLFTWMAATARNTAIDQLRSRAQLNADKNTGIDDLTNELDSKLKISLNPDTIGIKQLTCNLLPCDKKLLDLVYFEGYTHSEAAEKLNMPLGTVKTRLRRAISSLRSYF